MEQVLGGIRQKTAHYVFPVGATLPSVTIDGFRKSNGVVLKVGDRSHPSSVEVIASLPDWAEKMEGKLAEFAEVFSGATPSKHGFRDPRELGYIS
jgi:hypothetical protein